MKHRILKLFFATGLLPLAACHSSPTTRGPGQTSFVSAPGRGGPRGASGAPAEDTAAGAPPAAPGSGNKSASPSRAVEETDLYRLEGDRLYYLNGYRGLMVFDVKDPDHPGCSAARRSTARPVEMLVQNGVATVVVADWSARSTTGRHSAARSCAGSTPASRRNIKVVGEAKLGG